MSDRELDELRQRVAALQEGLSQTVEAIEESCSDTGRDIARIDSLRRDLRERADMYYRRLDWRIERIERSLSGESHLTRWYGWAFLGATIATLLSLGIAYHEWRYYSNHPHARGPSGVIALLALAVALGCATVSVLAWNLLTLQRHRASRQIGDMAPPRFDDALPDYSPDDEEAAFTDFSPYGEDEDDE